MVDTELADTAPQRRSGPWKLILIVAIVTLIGIWLVPGKKDESPAVSKPLAPPALKEGQAPSLLGEGEAPPATAEPDSAVVDSAEPATAAVIDDRPGARARALIAEMRASGEPRLDEAYEAARAAQAAGETADAYLLYFFAAREGHAPSALALGAQADPASHDPASSVFEAPDLTQAHKWYQLAAERGDEEGRRRLDTLRTRVEKLAAEGDPQAQRISLLWQ